MSEGSSNLHLDAEEKSLYGLLVWFLIWPLLFFIMRRFVPEVVASAASAFVFVGGAWFVDRSKRERISLARWIAISAIAALTTAVITFVIARP